MVFVDVAVCDDFDIAKYDRHAKTESNQTQETFHKQELQMMKELKPFERHGYILSKAVRIAAVSQPDFVSALGLEEDIYSDNVITSFLLKACLFGAKGIKTDFQECKTSLEVTITIYKLLYTGLKQKLVESIYTKERLVYCRFCRVERGCCKKRLFMKAMVEKILIWLNTNKSHLLDIDFA